MKKVLNIYEKIVMKCMSNPDKYVTKVTWSEVGIEGFGSLVTENCGDRIRASLVNKHGEIVFRKYFLKNDCFANVA